MRNRFKHFLQRLLSLQLIKLIKIIVLRTRNCKHRIHFLQNFLRPSVYQILYNLHSWHLLSRLIQLFLQSLDLILQSICLRKRAFCWDIISVDRQLMQHFLTFIVIKFQILHSFLCIWNSYEELSICLFSSEKFLDYVLDIRESCCVLNLLKCIFNARCFIHFKFHLFL